LGVASARVERPAETKKMVKHHASLMTGESGCASPQASK